LRRDVGVFERTPKYHIEGRSDVWRTKKYRADGTVSIVVEGLLAVWFTVAFVLAWRLGMWYSLPFLYLFLQGYSYMFLLSTLSTWGRPRKVIARDRSIERSSASRPETSS
jgi:hypothetical protein